jgi:hypothetical protein
MEYGHGMPYLSDRPVGEDADYLLTVAWNLAATHRIVYNFNKPTTGVQPLATFVDAGLARLVQAAGRDRWVFVRVVILVNVVLLILFAHLLGRIAMGAMTNTRQQDLADAAAVVTTVQHVDFPRVYVRAGDWHVRGADRPHVVDDSEARHTAKTGETWVRASPEWRADRRSGPERNGGLFQPKCHQPRWEDRFRRWIVHLSRRHSSMY